MPSKLVSRREYDDNARWSLDFFGRRHKYVCPLPASRRELCSAACSYRNPSAFTAQSQQNSMMVGEEALTWLRKEEDHGNNLFRLTTITKTYWSLIGRQLRHDLPFSRAERLSLPAQKHSPQCHLSLIERNHTCGYCASHNNTMGRCVIEVTTRLVERSVFFVSSSSSKDIQAS